MKKLLPFLILVLLNASINAQTVVLNQKLLEQLTKNQAVRLTSNQALKKSFESQNEIYNKVNAKVAEAIVIHEYIYKQLTNVNGLIKDGKKVKQIIKQTGLAVENSSTLLGLTIQNPHYAALKYEQYFKIYDRVLVLKDYFENELLLEKSDYLMDQYDRQMLVDITLYKIKEINSYLRYLIYLLQEADKISILKQIPILSNYYNLDKSIVNDIMYNLKHRF